MKPKLVRDNIPEIITATGRKTVFRQLKEAEYKQALLAKLVEEAQEAQKEYDCQPELVKELGDVLEVLDAICTAFGIGKEEIEILKKKRHIERGGFKKRYLLERIEE